MTDERATMGVGETLAGSRSDLDPAASGEMPIARGGTIGRFVVLARRGAGGMGIVYSAYDPELDRKVALKVLRPERRAERARLRLLREAQALAKLRHPAVVGIFDVGTIGERVWLAMELVEGTTLDAWLRAQPRGWRDVVRVMTRAGEGLAAAHAKGLVHRDFKPANVMVADNGARVVVMDFGLARTSRSFTSDSVDVDDESLSASHSGTLDSPLTRAGAIVGTPGYMAPEQLAGGELDARWDQFGFCVTLWEGLYGERPFEAQTGVAESVAALRHALRTPPSDRGVPRWIHKIVERGLAADANQRWPSMQDLLAALAQDPRRRAGRIATGVGLVVLVGGSAWSWSVARTAAATPCTGARDKLAGIWDEGARAAAEQGVLATAPAYAKGVWDRLAPTLDAYADAWVTAHVDACEATSVRGEQSEAALDLRMRCLDASRRQLSVLSGMLAAADADLVEHADDLPSQLPALERCSDLDALQADVPPPDPADADAVAEIREAIAAVRFARLAGKPLDAKPRLDEVAASVDALGYEPLATEIALERGEIAYVLGDAAAAEAAFAAALRGSLRWGQWDEGVRAATGAISAIADDSNRAEEALAFVDVARALAARRPDPEADEPALLHAIGVARMTQGRPADAERDCRAGIAILERRDETDRALANLRNCLANALGHLGRYEESVAVFDGELERSTAWLGPEHPRVATIRHNRAIALRNLGRVTEAESELRATIAIRERTLGPDHPNVASSHNTLANVLRDQNRLDEAMQELRTSLDVWSASLPAEHPRIAKLHANIGGLLHAQGRLEEAAAELRLASAGLRAAYHDDHPDVAPARASLGQVLQDMGQSEAAEVELLAALTITERAYGPEHPDALDMRYDLAMQSSRRGRFDLALPMLEAVWAVRGANEKRVDRRVNAAFELARALVETGGDRERAVALAQLARDLLRDGDTPMPKRQVQIEAFLREHGTR